MPTIPRIDVRRGLAAAVISAFCLCAAAAALADQPEDAWITTQVKMKLLMAESIDPFDINVDTFDGDVTLHGQVRSSDLKQQAESLAAEVEGVKDVRNMLAVVAEGAADRVEASDDELRTQIENVLDRDQALAKSDIEVESVNDGVVVLSGRAETLSAHRRALEDVRSVEGVRSVASEIRSPDELADREIWSEAADASSESSAVSDTWITSKAKMKLMADPGVSPLAFNVDTRDGVVTLFGAINSEQEKDAVEHSVREISGVRDVENELQVIPAVSADRIEASDERILADVRKRLDNRQNLRDDADIDVEVSKGVVRLSGTVTSFRDKMTALTIARTTEGVESIVDSLRVQEQQGG